MNYSLLLCLFFSFDFNFVLASGTDYQPQVFCNDPEDFLNSLCELSLEFKLIKNACLFNKNIFWFTHFLAVEQERESIECRLEGLSSFLNGLLSCPKGDCYKALSFFTTIIYLRLKILQQDCFNDVQDLQLKLKKPEHSTYYHTIKKDLQIFSSVKEKIDELLILVIKLDVNLLNSLKIRANFLLEFLDHIKHLDFESAECLTIKYQAKLFSKTKVVDYLESRKRKRTCFEESLALNLPRNLIANIKTLPLDRIDDLNVFSQKVFVVLKLLGFYYSSGELESKNNFLRKIQKFLEKEWCNKQPL